MDYNIKKRKGAERGWNLGHKFYRLLFTGKTNFTGSSQGKHFLTQRKNSFLGYQATCTKRLKKEKCCQHFAPTMWGLLKGVEKTMLPPKSSKYLSLLPDSLKPSRYPSQEAEKPQA